MRIRDSLTLRFTAIVAVILLLFCMAIYALVVRHAVVDFEDRLHERALNTAKLLLQVDEVDETLLKILRRKYLQSLPKESVRIFDEKNRVFFKDDTFDITIPHQKITEIRKYGEIRWETANAEGERDFTGILFRDNMKDYVVVASAIDVYGNKKINNLFIVLLTGYFILLIIILFSGRIFANQALRPISKVISQVEQITASNLHLRVDEGNKKDEIAMLAVTFNQMFQRIQNAFEMQKRFVSNASHELRTPLTAIRGEIEVTLMKERSVNEYKETLLSVMDESKRLTRLANGLLDLAQTGFDPSIISSSPINVDHLLQRVIDDVARRHKNRNLLVDLTSVNEETLFIRGNEELIHTAIKNIIANGFKFSGEKPLKVKVSKDRGSIVFSVTDEGIGMTEEEMEHIFLPFYRSPNVSNIPGHGIGLSLAEKIVKLHNGDIRVESKKDIGTTIHLFFPQFLEE